MYEQLGADSTAEQILESDFVKANLKDIFSVNTFGPLQMFPGLVSRKSLMNFVNKGLRANIVYGINGAIKSANKGLFSVFHLRLHGRRVSFFTCSTGKDAQTAVIFPGGAYMTCATAIEGLPIAAKLNELGYNSVIIEYSTGINASGKKPIEDVAEVISVIKATPELKNFRFDRYAAFGFSAGGHLAGCLADKNICAYYNLARPSTIALGYPVVSFEHYVHKRSRSMFLGLFDTKTNRKKWSLENIFSNDCPPVFMFHCKGDNVVSIENSRLLNARLNDLSIEHLYLEFDNGSHGYGLALDTVAQGWLNSAVEFWEQQLRKPDSFIKEKSASVVAAFRRKKTISPEARLLHCCTQVFGQYI